MNISSALSLIKEKGRLLDYYLINNLIVDSRKEVLKELLKYQNTDGGFGNALEPDVQMPYSSVLATNIAISILEEIEYSDNKLLTTICNYYITQFDSEVRMFKFVSSKVDEYPHAIWWNYDNQKSFGYFNPTPEVLGFLLKHRNLHNFDIENEIEYCIEKIFSDYLEVKDEHSLYSIIKLYNKLDESNQSKIILVIEQSIKSIITVSKDKWREYSPQPYKLLTRDMDIFEEYELEYSDNLNFILDSISADLVWYPEWEWYQQNEVFEKIVKFQWMGYITYERIKLLLRENRIEK